MRSNPTTLLDHDLPFSQTLGFGLPLGETSRTSKSRF